MTPPLNTYAEYLIVRFHAREITRDQYLAAAESYWRDMADRFLHGVPLFDRRPHGTT